MSPETSSPETSEIGPQEIGRPAPDFTLDDLNGRPVTLSSELNPKRGAVLVFWSAVCSHCLRYDDYLNQFSDRHPQLTLLAVASRQRESREDLLKTAKERNLTFRIFIDPGGRLAGEWSTQQTPRAFLIGPGRVLLYRGAIDNFQFPGDPDYAAYLEPAIDDFLAGKPVAQPETASFGCAIKSVYYQLPRTL
jgi:peroxiredoxin